jgi:chromosome segregation ATPase
MAAVLREEKFVEARIARLESDVAHIRTDVSELKQEMGEFRKDLGSVKETLAGHQGQFAALRAEIQGLRVEMNVKFEVITGKIESFRAEMVGKIAETRVWMLTALGGVLLGIANIVLQLVRH